MGCKPAGEVLPPPATTSGVRIGQPCTRYPYHFLVLSARTMTANTATTETTIASTTSANAWSEPAAAPASATNKKNSSDAPVSGTAPTNSIGPAVTHREQ